MGMVCTSECEYCKYGTVLDENRANVKVKCSIKGKSYFYGQYVSCDYFEKDKNKLSDTENLNDIQNITQTNNDTDTNVCNTAYDIILQPPKRKRGRPKGSKNKKTLKAANN